MLADTEWATCEPWSIVYAAVPTEHSKLLWAVGRIVRDYMCLRGLAQDGTVLVVTHNDWVTNWQGVLVWACPYFLTLAGTHMVSIEQERMSCKLSAWPSGQTGRFKDESAMWTLGRCLFWPVSLRREVGWIASDAARESDCKDSCVACFVKFSSAKFWKMNGNMGQFVKN